MVLSRSKNKIENIIILVLSVVLVITLTFGIIKDKKESKKNLEEYSEVINEDGKDKETSSDSVTQEPNEVVKDDVYSKLRKKESVNLLVLGDGLALSQGRTSDNGIWDQGVKSLIQNTYGSNVELKSLAKNGSSSAVGVETVKNNDISGYDLIVTCYGHNDNTVGISIEEFKKNYQDIINEIKTKNPNGTIITILPNTLSTDNEYSVAIKEVSNNNGIDFADTKTTFINSGLGEDNLINSGLPNDKGYQLYTETIGNVIKKKIQ